MKGQAPEIWIQKNLVKQGWEWSLVMPGNTMGEWQAATTLTAQTISEGAMTPTFMVLPDETMQRLMNQMWNAGFRPSAEGSAGELQATKAHLKDMRDIVFDLMQLKK